VKSFARISCFSTQTDQSQRVGNNSDKAAAASYRVAGFDGGNPQCRPGRPGRHLEDIQAMFDCENPEESGSLTGEFYASTLENHPRYPKLSIRRDADLLAQIDRLVGRGIDCVAELLPGLGFDDAGIGLYRSAALSAFRAAVPYQMKESARWD
jgi:hypothetical protein